MLCAIFLMGVLTTACGQLTNQLPFRTETTGVSHQNEPSSTERLSPALARRKEFFASRNIFQRPLTQISRQLPVKSSGDEALGEIEPPVRRVERLREAASSLPTQRFEQPTAAPDSGKEQLATSNEEETSRQNFISSIESQAVHNILTGNRINVKNDDNVSTPEVQSREELFRRNLQSRRIVKLFSNSRVTEDPNTSSYTVTLRSTSLPETTTPSAPLAPVSTEPRPANYPPRIFKARGPSTLRPGTSTQPTTLVTTESNLASIRASERKLAALDEELKIEQEAIRRYKQAQKIIEEFGRPRVRVTDDPRIAQIYGITVTESSSPASTTTRPRHTTTPAAEDKNRSSTTHLDRILDTKAKAVISTPHIAVNRNLARNDINAQDQRHIVTVQPPQSSLSSSFGEFEVLRLSPTSQHINSYSPSGRERTITIGSRNTPLSPPLSNTPLLPTLDSDANRHSAESLESTFQPSERSSVGFGAESGNIPKSQTRHRTVGSFFHKKAIKKLPSHTKTSGAVAQESFVKLGDLSVPKFSSMVRNVGVRLLVQPEIPPQPEIIDGIEAPRFSKMVKRYQTSTASQSDGSSTKQSAPVDDVQAFMIQGDKSNRIIFLNIAHLGPSSRSDGSYILGEDVVVPIVKERQKIDRNPDVSSRNLGNVNSRELSLKPYVKVSSKSSEKIQPRELLIRTQQSSQTPVPQTPNAKDSISITQTVKTNHSPTFSSESNVRAFRLKGDKENKLIFIDLSRLPTLGSGPLRLGGLDELIPVEQSNPAKNTVNFDNSVTDALGKMEKTKEAHRLITLSNQRQNIDEVSIDRPDFQGLNSDVTLKKKARMFFERVKNPSFQKETLNQPSVVDSASITIKPNRASDLVASEFTRPSLISESQSFSNFPVTSSSGIPREPRKLVNLGPAIPTGGNLHLRQGTVSQPSHSSKVSQIHLNQESTALPEITGRLPDSVRGQDHYQPFFVDRDLVGILSTNRLKSEAAQSIKHSTASRFESESQLTRHQVDDSNQRSAFRVESTQASPVNSLRSKVQLSDKVKLLRAPPSDENFSSSLPKVPGLDIVLQHEAQLKALQLKQAQIRPVTHEDYNAGDLNDYIRHNSEAQGNQVKTLEDSEPEESFDEEARVPEPEEIHEVTRDRWINVLNTLHQDSPGRNEEIFRTTSPEVEAVLKEEQRVRNLQFQHVLQHHGLSPNELAQVSRQLTVNSSPEPEVPGLAQHSRFVAELKAAEEALKALTPGLQK